MAHKSRSGGWKAKLNRSTENSFIGRELQLQAFRGALSTPHEERTTSIFSISGQGGIGKTTLLKRFRKITEELGQVAVYVDEGSQTNTVDNMPEALSQLALDLEKQGIELKKFREQYKVYRQKKQELEADPEAPQGFASGMGKFIAKAGLGMAKSIPGSGGVLEFVDSEGVVNQAGEWATFVARKLTNKDEVRLVQEPLEVLTPLFLEDLNQVAEKQPVVLLLDTYEQTGAFLDDWLRALLNDRYDESLHPNCLICIAGRDPLNKNAWIEWEELIARSELEPFTEAEARLYLASCAITQESIVQEIWRLSSEGLPILIAMMAQEAPREIEQITDPCEDAVERFLKWEKDEKKRKIAQNAALPRVLNRDVLAVLTNDEEADALFEWLKSRSFVVQHPNGWQYHSLVREQILRYQRKVSLKLWGTLHEKLANYYDELRQGLKLEESRQWKDETWQQYSLEWLYHILCMAPQQSLSTALNGWLAALRQDDSFAQEWADVMANAWEATNCRELKFWGDKLHNFEKDEQLADILSLLLEGKGLKDKERAFALTYRVLLALKMLLSLDRTANLDNPQFDLRNATDFNSMIEILNQAIELDSNISESFFLRGFLNILEGNLNEAEADFTLTINAADNDVRKEMVSIQEKYFEIITTLREKGRDFAGKFGLADLFLHLKDEHKQLKNEIERLENKIEQLKNKHEQSKNEIEKLKNETQILRAESFRVRWVQKNYKAAQDTLRKSITENPNDYWIWCALGEIFLFCKNPEEATKALNRAFQINSQDSRIYYAFALLHLTLNELDSFKAKLATAIQIAEIRYNQAPNDWHNVLELALYYLVNNKATEADLLYRQAVTQQATRNHIRVAICDLQIFITLFPNSNQVQQIINLLEAAIA